MKKTIFLVIFLICNFQLLIVSAQTHEIDSLKNLLENAKQDTVKINLMNELAFEFMNTDSALTIKYAKQAKQLAEKIDYKKGIAESFYHTGYMYHKYVVYTKSIKYLSESLEIYKQLNYEKLIAKNYFYLGYSFFKISNNVAALENMQNALTMFKKIDNKIQIGNCYIVIGGIYKDQENLILALNYYEKALVLFKSIDSKEGVASMLYSIANVYKDKGENDNNTEMYEKAMEYYQNSLEIYKEVGGEYGICTNLQQIGYLYIQNQEYEKAKEYCTQSLELSKKLDNKMLIGFSYLNLAKYYHAVNNNQQAIIHTQKSLTIFEQLERKQTITYVYKLFSDIYKTKNNYRLAYENYVKYKEFHDSIYNDDNTKKITELQMQYKYEKEKELQELEQLKQQEILNAEIKQQKTIRNIFIAGLFAAILLIFLFIRLNRIRKRTNNLLTLKNTEINQQKEEIQTQADELNNKNESLSKANSNIKASINYAKRIQQGMLSSQNILNENFSENFILNKPKDIVSGDFYYFNKVTPLEVPIHDTLQEGTWDVVIFAVADCTGHGVPGGFMTMLGLSFIDDIVKRTEIMDSASVLNTLRDKIISSLKQDKKTKEIHDGMDIAFCAIDKNNLTLSYAGAYRPLYIIRNQELIITKADKMPIGIYLKMNNFTNNNIQLQKNDLIYLFSDGYTDQFGGENNQKFSPKQFNELLLSISPKPMTEQKLILEQTFNDWHEDVKQIDDVLIVGIKI